MTIWLTSDQHFGHKNIIEYSKRPFADVEEMNHGLIERHNSVVKDGDEVWHVGDFALNEKLVPVILPQLKGIHRLVVGNHDRCHPAHKRSEAARDRYLGYGFREVLFDVRIGIFLVSHLPYLGDNDSGHEARYPQFRPKDEGSFLIHGHVHTLWKTNGRMINVGVDVWDLKPVMLETVLKTMTK